MGLYCDASHWAVQVGDIFATCNYSNRHSGENSKCTKQSAVVSL